MQEVVVTGIGLVLPNCDSRETFWQQLRDGDSQLSFTADPLDATQIAPMGRIDHFDASKYLGEFPEEYWEFYHRELQFYLSSLVLARNDAGLETRALSSDRVGLFDGTSRGSFDFWYDKIRTEGDQRRSKAYTLHELTVATPGQPTGVAASLLQITGPTYTFTGSCSSGAIAIGHAFRELRSGEIDIAFATGHETAFSAPMMQMYKGAKLLSAERGDARRAVRPYVDHSTNAFGEGAMTLVLETREHAERRGARILAALAGYRYGNNGEHPTRTDSSGERPARVIRTLLENSGVNADAVRFVVGHGNGVPMSDLSELNYMQLVFGERTREVPLISIKPIYGHTVGASSALNVAAAVLMVHHQYIIPTINIDEARVKPGFNHQANHGKPDACEAGLSMSYGIGGHNTAVLVRRAANGSSA